MKTRCPHCGNESDGIDPALAGKKAKCGRCGESFVIAEELPTFEEAPAPRTNHRHFEAPRFPALRIIAGLYRFAGWFVGVAAAVVLLYSVATMFDGILYVAFGLGGLVAATFLIATAEAIDVALAIEWNTRPDEEE